MLGVTRFIGFTITSLLISLQALLFIKYQKYKTKHYRKHLNINVNKNTFKSMFVTQKNRFCLPHLNIRLICAPTCSYLYLKNIISVVDRAKESLSVCMYHFSIDDLHHAIVHAHKRGLTVRLLSDTVMLSSTGSKLIQISRNNIPVKTQKSRIGLMHHKFLLIDEYSDNNSQVLFGSLNYTINAFINNWEFVVLTRSPKVVIRFRDEFEHLWQSKKFQYINK